MIFKNKKSKFRCGILGCGNIAGSYDSPKSNKVRTHAKAFLKNKNCSLISVCDNSLIKAKDFANTWGASFYYDNIDEFLKDNLDIISICTPTETHRVIFEKVVIHSPKFIWLEKLSANTSDDIRKMIGITKKRTVRYVFHKEYQQKKSKVCISQGITTKRTVRYVFPKE